MDKGKPLSIRGKGEFHMKDSAKVFLGFAIAAAAVLVLVVSKHMASRVTMNEGYVNGNTGSNLYNNGLICENGDTLYFANPDDGFRLYARNRNGSDLRKLSDDVASFINVDDNYVYYTRNNASDDSQFSFLHIDTNSLCRIKKEGGKVAIIDHDPDIYASLVGNYVYFLHYGKSDATTLYRTRIDGKETEQIDPNPLYPCASSRQYIYYSGVGADRNLYRMDTTTGKRGLVLTCDCWNPVVLGGYAYYMSPSEGYHLIRADLATQETTTLTTDRVDCFLVDGDTVVYQKNSQSDPALMRISLTTGETSRIVSGNYHSLNSAFGQLYFMMFDDDETIYTTSLGGGSGVSVFHPGTE